MVVRHLTTIVKMKILAKKEKKKKKRRKKKPKKYGSGERIVNGYTPDYPMPWMVVGFYEGHQCGGSLINKEFVLTGAHCPCFTGMDLCSRNMGEVAKEPVTIKDGAEKKVTIFIGATCTNKKDCSKTEGARELLTQKKAALTYPVKKMFIHPKLGTSEIYYTNPDLCLVQLAKPVPEFSNYVRPLCLSDPSMPVKPKCEDNTRDRDPTPQETRDDLIPRGSKKILGGCATVAGWGHRYNAEDFENNQAECSTDHSSIAPAKLELCTGYWEMDGEGYSNCTKENIKDDVLPRACALLAQELNFVKALDTKNGVKKKKSKFGLRDLNELVTDLETPIEILVKRKAKKPKIFHCSKTDFSEEKKKRGLEWLVCHQVKQ